MTRSPADGRAADRFAGRGPFRSAMRPARRLWTGATTALGYGVLLAVRNSYLLARNGGSNDPQPASLFVDGLSDVEFGRFFYTGLLAGFVTRLAAEWWLTRRRVPRVGATMLLAAAVPTLLLASVAVAVADDGGWSECATTDLACFRPVLQAFPDIVVSSAIGWFIPWWIRGTIILRNNAHDPFGGGAGGGRMGGPRRGGFLPEIRVAPPRTIPHRPGQRGTPATRPALHTGPGPTGTRGVQVTNRLKDILQRTGGGTMSRNITVKGQVSWSEVDHIGRQYVGEGYKVRSYKNGREILVSKDGLREYHRPTIKQSSPYSETGVSANFKWRPATNTPWSTNVHLDVRPDW